MDQPSPFQGVPQPPVAAQPAPEPAPKPRKRFPWARLLAVLLAFGLIGSLFLNLVLLAVVSLTSLESEGRVQEKFYSHQRSAHDKVAILSIKGTILDAESGFFKRQLDRATKDAKDGDLKALVVRVDSPGGTITGSDYIYHHLRELRQEAKLPIVVSMGGLAASGGYYVSMAVGEQPKTIYAEPTTWTGSIGVIIPHYDLSPLMKNWGIQDDSVMSNPLKGMGSFTRPMTEEEKKIFQHLVDDGLARFKEIVKEGRPQFRKDPAALDKLATGQVFTAEQAKQHGLVDEIGFVDEAIDRAIELAGLDKDNVRVVEYKPEPALTDLLLGSAARGPSRLDLGAVLEASAPRAHYLYTALPLLSTSARP